MYYILLFYLLLILFLFVKIILDRYINELKFVGYIFIIIIY